MASQDAIRWRLLRDYIRQQARELQEEGIEPCGDDWDMVRQFAKRLEEQAI